MKNNAKKNHDDKFKLKVAIAMIKGNKSVTELCAEFDIAQSQAYAWKRDLFRQKKN